MPNRAQKICPAAGCHTLILSSQQRCSEHPIEIGKFKNKVRVAKYERFYTSSPWRKMRTAFIQQFPVCVHCIGEAIDRLADVVDHITPIREDWNKRLEWSNLQSLCHSHHNSKTAKDTHKQRQHELDNRDSI